MDGKSICNWHLRIQVVCFGICTLDGPSRTYRVDCPRYNHQRYDCHPEGVGDLCHRIYFILKGIVTVESIGSSKY